MLLRWAWVWLGLMFVLPVEAKPAVDRKPKHVWTWLTQEDETRLMRSIPPAPATNSEEDRADLAGVLKAQRERTAAEIAEARRDERFRLEMMSQSLAPDFTPKRYPLTFRLLNGVREDESTLNSKLKKQYDRPRPYQAHREVRPLFKVEQASYPSGHASGAYVLAAVLAELFPEHKSDLMARADAVGKSRVTAGVHYPSDVAEGRKLGTALVAALMANDDFRRDLDAATVEVGRSR